MMDRSVEVKVGEKAYTLSLTLSAMEKIDSEFGSLMEASERVRLRDFDAICRVIVAGAGLSIAQAKALRDEVFRAGILNVCMPVHAFVLRLFDPEGTGEAEDDEPGEA